jgi:hypothetical protein
VVVNIPNRRLRWLIGTTFVSGRRRYEEIHVFSGLICEDDVLECDTEELKRVQNVGIPMAGVHEEFWTWLWEA